MADSAVPSAGRVFISYRREETRWQAGWLYDRLADRFGSSQIFKDIDSIKLGDDFVDEITTAVGSCDVLLALIGDQWLTITDNQGRARLDNPKDLVRVEIEAALTRHVRVIPILIEGARMPDSDQLPPSLAKLADRQALELSPSHFESGTSQLLRVINSTLADAATRARREAEDQARRDAEEQARREADERARRVHRTRAENERPTRDATIRVKAPTSIGPPPLGTPSQQRSLKRLMPKTGPARMIIVGIIALLVVASVVTAVLIAGNSSHTPPESPSPFTFTTTLHGHTKGVRSVAFSRDGILATGSSDGTTRLWDVASGKKIRQLPQSPIAGDHNVVATAFNSDGTVLATGSSDNGTIRLWNPNTGTELPSPRSPLSGGKGLKSLAFRPKSQTLASTGSDGEVRFWNTSTGMPTGNFPADQTTVEGLAFNEDGSMLATGSWGGLVKLWDSRQRPLSTLPGHTRQVFTVAFSHDGSILASASADNDVRLWNVAKRGPFGQPLRGHKAQVIGVAFSPVGNLLASGSLDHTVRLWDAATGKAVGNPLGDGKALFSGVAFSPDGKTLAAGTADGSVWLWTANSGSTAGATTH
jgi:WD40 repeat protein